MVCKGSINRHTLGLYHDGLGKTPISCLEQSIEDTKAILQPRSLCPKKAPMTYAGEREAFQAPIYDRIMSYPQFGLPSL